MQVLTISTYDYIRNTCLHYIDELKLLCIALGCDCYMMNVIQHNYPSLIQFLCFSHIDLCQVTIAVAVTITTNLLLLLSLLLLLLLLLLSKLSYYCATKYFAVDICSPGVVELTT